MGSGWPHQPRTGVPALRLGVRYRGGGATTESLVMRSKSGTIRRVSSEHRLSKLSAYSAIDFEHAGR